MVKKNKIKYLCNGCGYETNKWLGKCPQCNIYNSFVEIIDEDISKTNINLKEPSAPIKLTEIDSVKITRQKTGISEFDELIGGGIVPSSLILLGGSPGIGKSTLMLQIIENLSDIVLYIAGEESPEQIKIRADRLKLKNPKILLLQEIEISKILNTAEKIKPSVIVIDSIQTIYDSAVQSAPGNINQVRECALKLMEYAKPRNIVVFIIGHITKTGEFAGPRVLEHLVDTALYFEGEKTNDFRILKSIKNRFGATNEIAVFEMTDKGLRGINNYSNLFYFNRKDKVAGVSNSVVIEGSRPLLIEIQALVNSAIYGNARRVARGISISRLSVIIAVIEKHCGISLIDKDVFVNITGGLDIDDPAIDLAIAMSIISSVKDRAISVRSAFIGELGLTGEIRAAARMLDRFNECRKNGIDNCIVSDQNILNFEKSDISQNIKIHTIGNIKELLKYF
ncbi:MAG TPA: DNA repair protein RadA [bacterium]|nr:DNA repair protein RadA [bacterium]